MNSFMSSSADRSTIFSFNVFGSSPSSSNVTRTNSPSSSPSSSRINEDEKVKVRLLSMWNNMKFGMKLKTNFSKESPVWLLGKCYHRKVDNPDNAEMGTDIAAFQSHSNIILNTEEDGLEGFKQDFISRIWLTYRREFPILNGSSYSSDCGWGCMLRSGQMLLAQGLVAHFLGRNWRWGSETMITHSVFPDVYHRKILKWFGDKPSINSPFSIHALVNIGEESGKKAGDWYGPASVAHILKNAVKNAANDNFEFDSLTVYVSQDCAVYIQDVLELCTTKDNKWKSVFLFVPVKLGAEKFNQIYAPCLTALFTLEQCIGVIGGRPKHSLYFVGYQDDKLIHLDPHYCQEMVDVWSADFLLSSFHCKSPRKMHISKMDPSCCIGFYCKTKEEFFNLIETVKTVVYPPANKSEDGAEYPMFVFSEGSSRDAQVQKKKEPPVDMEYSYDGAEGDLFLTEEFEVI